MEQEVKQANQMPQEEEIDLVEVVRKLWKNRKLILKITVVFMVLGVLVALFSPKEYTAGCTMVPQSGDKKVGGNLSGLASMVGINLGGASGGEVLSPTIYPKIVASIPFKKDLMATPLKFEEYVNRSRYWIIIQRMSTRNLVWEVQLRNTRLVYRE